MTSTTTKVAKGVPAVPLRQALGDVFALMSDLRGFRAVFLKSLVAMFVAKMLLVLLTAVSVHVSALIVQRILPLEDAVWPIVIIIAMCIGQGFGVLLECWWSHELAYRVLASLRVDIYAALRRIAPRGLQHRRTADVAARSMGDVEQLEWFYAHTAATAINAVITSVLLVGITCWFIGPLGLILIPTLLVMVAFPIALLPWQRRQGDRMRTTLSDLKVLTLDGIHGLRELHVLGLHHRHRDQLRRRGREVQRALLRSDLRKTLEAGVAQWQSQLCTSSC